MTELTPEAQAVVDAYEQTTDKYAALAAVLRAAADQVVPIEYEDIQGCWYEKKNSVREQFLTIANELEELK